MSTPTRPVHRRLLRYRWPLAVLVIALAAAPTALRYLVFWPLDQWQVDVQVYRDAGVSVLTGRPVYATLTEAPQLLPFTYPPFAALLSIPLALVPFGVVGWLWTALQVIATVAITWYAAHRLLWRTGPWWPLALAVLSAPMLWLHPVGDGIRFGQVNALIVLACLVDLREPRPRLARWLPPGAFVGLAMAVKLTPGVFVIHYLVTRRWREAATAVATAALVTIGSALVLPQASVAFWLGALQDSDRLGPNAGTANQSMRGFLLRMGLDGTAGGVLWLVLVAVVGVLGFGLARRLDRRGDTVAVVAVVGLLACLLSPVAWVHHYHWVVVVVFALLGPDPWRDRRRLWAGAAVTVFFTMRLPWWGIDWLAQRDWPEWPGRILQNADVFGGLACLLLLWWATRVPDAAPERAAVEPAARPAVADA
ncbi:glycosyltransferase 87 family protein [Phycicoccus duodecadis]|uniref:glycosyltransferase 87 family protein n=1 Tax=Phycicoccus duodecadis TaxID=173053 RepID=UPI001FE2E866|nr:glycosyltransferase 87 family protein [Phycicoccus duodecadis]